VRRFALHPFEDDIAARILGEALKSQLTNESRNGRLPVRPEPGRAEIEAVSRWLTDRVNREDASAGPTPGFEQGEVDAGLMQSSCRVQPGKSGSEDGDSGVGHVVSFRSIEMVRRQPNAVMARMS
jgi:hypothetical protein